MFLYSDKTWVFDQSERAQGPIYILMVDNCLVRGLIDLKTFRLRANRLGAN